MYAGAVLEVELSLYKHKLLIDYLNKLFYSKFLKLNCTFFNNTFIFKYSQNYTKSSLTLFWYKIPMFVHSFEHNIIIIYINIYYIIYKINIIIYNI
jgi:hypothetical protein